MYKRRNTLVFQSICIQALQCVTKTSMHDQATSIAVQLLFMFDTKNTDPNLNSVSV